MNPKPSNGSPFKANRRKYQRVRIPPEVHLRCWGDDFRGLVRVLGEGGLFVDTIKPTSNGVELQITIEIDKPIQARALTRYHEAGEGMGLEFVDLPADQRNRIKQLVSKYS